MYIVSKASGCTHQKASFVFLDDLDNVSILLDEDNGLEEEITHLFNEESTFIFKFEKNPTTNQSLNMLKKCTVIRGNFELFKFAF